MLTPLNKIGRGKIMGCPTTWIFQSYQGKELVRLCEEGRKLEEQLNQYEDDIAKNGISEKKCHKYSDICTSLGETVNQYELKYKEQYENYWTKTKLFGLLGPRALILDGNMADNRQALKELSEKVIACTWKFRNSFPSK